MSSKTSTVNAQPYPQRRSGEEHELLFSLQRANRPERGCLKCHPFQYGDQEALGCLVEKGDALPDQPHFPNIKDR